MTMTADNTKNGDTISTYPGGKGLIYQRLISLIPPHDTYIAAFAGFDAIARMKRPARVNIAIDADAAALVNLRSAIAISGERIRKASLSTASGPGQPTPEMTMLASSAGNGDSSGVAGRIASNGEATRWEFLNTDALAWLAAYDWRGGEFLYCDPPYVRSTRKQARALYRYEMTDDQHRALLSILLRLPCPVMVSGYYSEMYAQALTGWRVAMFETTTRGGSPATEWVWMNYPAPVALHDYRYLGDGFRERERIKRKKRRWVEKLRKMGTLEKQAILAAIAKMEQSQ
jgi:DNA adenine methylase